MMETIAIRELLNLTEGVYAIAGISKNCGKTTLLNSIIAHNTGKMTGVLTTGRDGEKKDVLFGNPKPAVQLMENNLFVAASDVSGKLGTAVQVLSNIPFCSAGQQLWLLKALRNIETEISGPAVASAQMETAEIMRQHGAEIVLIDGSLDRKSVALHPKIKGVFVVVGGSFGSLEDIKSELSRLIQLSHLQRYSDKNLFALIDSPAIYRQGIWQRLEQDTVMGYEKEVCSILQEKKPEKFYFKGAVTDSVLNQLKPALKSVREVVVRHPLQLRVSSANLQYLLNEHILYSLRTFRIMLIAVNSWSVTGNHLDSQVLRNSIRDEFQSFPVLDVFEETPLI